MIGSYLYTGSAQEIDEEAARDFIREGYLSGPRTVLKGRTKAPYALLPKISVEASELPSKTQDILLAAMGRIAGARRAMMFSGGFDSMLIACLAKQAGARIAAVTVRFDDFNPLTVAGAVEFAGKAGIEHHILNVGAVEFLSAFEAIAAMTDGPIADLDMALVYAALKKYDPSIAGEIFISGMGSDQWFGDGALQTRQRGLDVNFQLSMVDEEMHHKVAQAHGCQFVFPFLSKPMLALSQCVPVAMKKDKKLLRALAVANTIPPHAARSEAQVPPLMRELLIKTFGDRAWPSPVSIKGRDGRGPDELVRQIILGLWLQKAKGRIAEV